MKTREDCIYYRSGYKYQLARPYTVEVPEMVGVPGAVTEYISLVTGVLEIRSGYAWDGPSGPAIDTANFMRGSLVHDALYQLLRARLLPSDCREPADRALQRICREDQMTSVRAWWVYHGVRLGGGPSADPARDKEILAAPRECPDPDASVF